MSIWHRAMKHSESGNDDGLTEALLGVQKSPGALGEAVLESEWASQGVT